jgi:hypothetical protein
VSPVVAPTVVVVVLPTVGAASGAALPVPVGPAVLVDAASSVVDAFFPVPLSLQATPITLTAARKDAPTRTR